MNVSSLANGAIAMEIDLTSEAIPTECISLPPTTTIASIHDHNSSIVVTATLQNNDPVTKAVLDNILGKLPTKKPTIVVTCDVCNLEFSGQVVLDMHLAGAKHAKKVKSQEILTQLRTTGETFTRDDKTKILKCDVCNIVVNSSQQLQTHLSGNKHKQKAFKKGSQPNGETTPVKKPNTTVTGSCNVPAGVQVLPDAAGSKTKKYYCDTCNVPLNSEVQLEQHLSSRKHKDRLKPKPKRPAPYFRRQTNFSSVGRGLGRGMKKSLLSSQYHNPLSSNFVSGGKINYSPDYPSNYSPPFSSNFSPPMQY